MILCGVISNQTFQNIMNASILKNLSTAKLIERVIEMHPELPARVASNRAMSAAEQLANPDQVYKATREECLIIRECNKRSSNLLASLALRKR